MSEYSVVGKRVARVDGVDRVTGKALYGDDIRLPEMLHGKILRSPHAHARIVRVDTSQAEKLPGVKAVITHKDFPDLFVGLKVRDRRVLAKEKALYVGMPVAAVAAVDPETAEEALDLIEVEYEVLPPVIDPFEGSQPQAPLLHEQWQQYQTQPDVKNRSGNISSHNEVKIGDVEKGFAESDYIFEDRFSCPMAHQTYMEPHAATAAVNSSGEISVWTVTQGIYTIRNQICEALLLPMSKVRVIPMEIGGGFGGKNVAFLEPLVVKLAMKTGRPVKILMSRDEDFKDSTPRHSCVIELKTGVKRDGTLVARHGKIYFGTGAFARSPMPMGSVNRLGGPYKIPHLFFESYAVYTNQPPGGAYRAPGSPQITFATESQIDMIAAKLGIDPIELRRKNALTKSDKTTIGSLAESADLHEVIDLAIKESGWNTKKLKKYQGRGLALGFWASGGQVASGCVEMNEDGTVSIFTGAVELTGTNTMMVQVAAEVLGLPIDRISIRTGDTSSTPIAPISAGSNITRAMGRAIQRGSEGLKQKLLKAASDRLEASIDDLDLKDGRVYVKGSPDRGVTFRELYGVAARSLGGPPGETGRTEAQSATVNFTAQVVDVEVDPETGEVKVLDLTILQDVGFALNPMMVEGQMEGGAIQGLGYGLMEEMAYDPKSGRLLNPHLLDYKIPCSLDVPNIKTVLIEVPASDSPFGVKGVGEPPIIATAAALNNAIHNAVGVWVRDLPITPDKIVKALKEREQEMGQS
ncbi:MAG: xanthine dehydrogenase family protein molybdopterin-binding subunit [Candidatus Tectomicrobia bacterium]|nr:xanthine dehydrogenase family protein molybdopterin-binding subunit [Candidatus Tectomicrobia bacterium]